MGAGASFQEGNSLSNRKFRKLILLKAYNKRDRSISVRQQFMKLVQTDQDARQDGRSHSSLSYIKTNDLLLELGMGEEQMEAMCKRFGVEIESKIDFSEFMYFMEHGGEQCSSPTHSDARRKKRYDNRRVTKDNEPAKENYSPPVPVKVTVEEEQEPEPVEVVAEKESSNQEPSPQKPDSGQVEEVEVAESKEQEVDQEVQQEESKEEGKENEGDGSEVNIEPIIEEPESDDEEDKKKDEKKSVTVKQVHINPEEITTLVSWEEKIAWSPDRRNLWKKREIVVNERTTEYTKVDELGVAQVLIESEKTQYEVLHMENKEGEFAHKETNTFEQFEKFNDELVMHEKGNDNLVHLKSHEDEVSHHWTEGVMPNQDQEGNGPQGTADFNPEQAEGAQAEAGMEAPEHMPEPEAVDHPNWLDSFKAPYHKILFFLEESEMVACTIVCKEWCVTIFDFVRFMNEVSMHEQMMNSAMEGGMEEGEEGMGEGTDGSQHDGFCDVTDEADHPETDSMMNETQDSIHERSYTQENLDEL